MSSVKLRHDFVYYGLSAESAEQYRVARRTLQSQTGNSTAPTNVVQGFLTQKGQAGSDITDAPLQLLNRKLVRIMEDLEKSGPKNEKVRRQKFDSQAAPLVFETLNSLPFVILNDIDFWRYVAVHIMYDLVNWRYPKDNGSRWGSNPTQAIRTITYAWFIRGQLCQNFNPDEIALVNKVGDIDIWTSHVIAVLHGSSSAIMFEYFRKCVEWQKPNGGWDQWGRLAFRDLAKQLKALRSNYVFDIIDKLSAKQIVDRLAVVSEQIASMKIDSEDDEDLEEE
jgi:hypothetical protein